MAPEISIIIPVYKVEQFLRKCLTSVQQQTFTDFECILINDGSPDNSEKICLEFTQSDSRFIYLSQENKGVSAARNYGLSVVKGKYICFIDSDDYVQPEYLESFHRIYSKNNADVVITRHPHSKNNKYFTKTFSQEQAIIQLFSDSGFGAYSFTKCIKAELINKLRFDPNVTFLEDTLFFYNVFKNCSSFIYENINFYNYYNNPDSVTRQKGLTPQSKTGLEMLQQIEATETNPKIKQAITEALGLFASFLYADHICKNDTTSESFIYLKKLLFDRYSQLIHGNITIKAKLRLLLLKHQKLYYFYKKRR